MDLEPVNFEADPPNLLKEPANLLIDPPNLLIELGVFGSAILLEEPDSLGVDLFKLLKEFR